MLKIFDINDNALEVEVIRYFKLNNKNYFMYTLNEADEQNYLKLYALKVTENLQGEKIVDDAEWAIVKDEIKVIIKGNKEGNLVIEDLNFEELKNFKVSETRAFKLSAQLVDLLKANKKEFPAESFDVASAMSDLNIEAVESVFDMTLPVETELEPIAVMPEPVTEVMPEPLVEPVIEPVAEVMPEPVVEPVIEPVAEVVPEPVVEPAFDFTPQPIEEELTPSEVAPITTEDFAMPTEQFVADYSFETEDDEPTPVVADKIEETFEEKDELEVNTNFDNDFKLLYEEEKELTEVLKNEISELREKLSKITQILSQ